MRQMFEEPVKVFVEVESRHLSICGVVLALALKNMVEYVRQETFGVCGLHQLQVDVYYMKRAFLSFVEDAR